MSLADLLDGHSTKKHKDAPPPVGFPQPNTHTHTPTNPHFKFLTKLYAICESCPIDIGEWDGNNRFVVKLATFADILKEHFSGSQQTFIRQLHFYGFTKTDQKDNTWAFTHKFFHRGRPDLLVNIKRKRSAKDTNGGNHDEPAAASAPPAPSNKRAKVSSSPPQPAAATQNDYASEARFATLEFELHALKAEVAELREMIQPLSGLVSLGGKPLTSSASFASKVAAAAAATSIPQKAKMVSESPVNVPAPPRLARDFSAVTDLGGDTLLKDFPFEDTSSLGSFDTNELIKELQMGFEIESFKNPNAAVPPRPDSPSAPAPSSSQPDMNDVPSLSAMCPNADRSKCPNFTLPEGFRLADGVTQALLKSVFDIVKSLVNPFATPPPGLDLAKLRWICHTRPSPQKLSPPESCPVGHAMLPIIRERLPGTEKPSDLILLKTFRQVYEVFYETFAKKCGAAATVGSAPSSSTSAAATEGGSSSQ